MDEPAAQSEEKDRGCDIEEILHSVRSSMGSGDRQTKQNGRPIVAQNTMKRQLPFTSCCGLRPPLRLVRPCRADPSFRQPQPSDKLQSCPRASERANPKGYSRSLSRTPGASNHYLGIRRSSRAHHSAFILACRFACVKGFCKKTALWLGVACRARACNGQVRGGY